MAEPPDSTATSGPSSPSPATISAKQAVQAAVTCCTEVIGRSDITVEELELDAQRTCWRVTLAFVDRPPSSPSMVYPDVPLKVSKVFTVDAASGAVVAMKDRQP